ncbi:MAG: hypothetical protein FH756_14015 [Firmicutes bacterium]|nr:hypothetical protein [Bacillota bacterium]
MLVGIDICNTIANVNYELLHKFNLNLKKYPAPEVPDNYFLTKAGLKVFKNARPFYQAKDILWQMAAQGCRLVYVTSRPKVANFITRRWLEVNEFPKGKVEFLSSRDKAIMAKDSGMVAFFDDDPVVIMDLLELSIPINIYVKTAPYNRHFNASNIVKFQKWGQLRHENLKKFTGLFT